MDLYVSGDFDVSGFAKALSIKTVGIPFDGKARKGVVYRLSRAPRQPVKYRYLVVSDKIEEPADIVTVRDFRRAKEKMKKKLKRGTGLEVTIASARKMDAAAVGRWLEDIGVLHSLCHSSRCQLILSSGATSMHEMVSGPCMDVILKNCGINPERHWREMTNWLEARLLRRVSV